MNRPVLLLSFGAGDEDLSEAIYIVGERAKDKMESDKGELAIRVCSSQPLILSLLSAYGNPFLAMDSLAKNHSISRSKTLFLRNDKNCRPTSTEFWFVPKDAEFPEFVEFEKAGQLGRQVLISDDYLFDAKDGEGSQKLNPRLFESGLKKLLALLKEDRMRVVEISYPNSQNPELAARVAKSREFLLRAGISDYRVHVKKLNARAHIHGGEMVYPNIVVAGKMSPC